MKAKVFVMGALLLAAVGAQAAESFCRVLPRQGRDQTGWTCGNQFGITYADPATLTPGGKLVACASGQVEAFDKSQTMSVCFKASKHKHCRILLPGYRDNEGSTCPNAAPYLVVSTLLPMSKPAGLIVQCMRDLESAIDVMPTLPECTR